MELPCCHAPKSLVSGMSTGSHRATNQIGLRIASLGFPGLFSRARAFTVNVRLEFRPDTRFKFFFSFYIGKRMVIKLINKL